MHNEKCKMFNATRFFHFAFVIEHFALNIFFFDRR
jgi:hypothetical protein